MRLTAPPLVETPRLRLRPPVSADAEAIFTRYAADAAVTRFLSWPRHVSVHDTDRFVAFSVHEWDTWPGGPYLIERRADGALIGSTGLAFESPQVASTGYVLARDAWGYGFATEALAAMVGIAAALGLPELTAVCHPENRPSARVLEKGGFLTSAAVQQFVVFPNLPPGRPVACQVYRRALRAAS